jgi:RNA polymerase sporulation-specific sigma factor
VALSDGYTTRRYYSMLDEEVIAQAHRGDCSATEHLLARYRNLVEGKARSYFLVGADHDDVVQEGMIGLFKAIRDFRIGELSHFRAFAEMCVTRQIITAIKAATRQKHVPLNQYISIQRQCCGDDQDGGLSELIADAQVLDPERVFVEQQFGEFLHGRVLCGLSSLETRVLNSYLTGSSYREIAAELGCGQKAIDNALQRVKRKVGERILARSPKDTPT